MLFFRQPYRYFQVIFIILSLILSLFILSNPNEGGDNDGVEGNESYWHEYTLPEMTFKELNEGLPDIKAYRASFCRFWNQQMPKLVSFTGMYSSFTIVCKYFFVYTLRSVSDCCWNGFFILKWLKLADINSSLNLTRKHWLVVNIHIT